MSKSDSISPDLLAQASPLIVAPHIPHETFLFQSEEARERTRAARHVGTFFHQPPSEFFQEPFQPKLSEVSYVAEDGVFHNKDGFTHKLSLLHLLGMRAGWLTITMLEKQYNSEPCQGG